MRGIILAGKIEGWSGLDTLVNMLRQEGLTTMSDLKPAPTGLWTRQLNDNVVLTLVGSPDGGYAFSVTVHADAEVISGIHEQFTAPGADVYLENLSVMEVKYRVPTRI